MALPGKDGKKPPAKKADDPASRFSPNQVSEDTEREMMGKQQRYGAAMQEDEPADEEEPEGDDGEEGEGEDENTPENEAKVEPVDVDKRLGDCEHTLSGMQADIDLIKSKLGIANGPENSTPEPGYNSGQEEDMGDGLLPPIAGGE